jgi:hypothetical protein
MYENREEEMIKKTNGFEPYFYFSFTYNAYLLLVELRKVDEVLVLHVRSSSPRRGLTQEMAQTRPSK